MFVVRHNNDDWLTFSFEQVILNKLNLLGVISIDASLGKNFEHL